MSHALESEFSYSIERKNSWSTNYLALGRRIDQATPAPM